MRSAGSRPRARRREQVGDERLIELERIGRGAGDPADEIVALDLDRGRIKVARTPPAMNTQITIDISRWGWKGYQATARSSRIGP